MAKEIIPMSIYKEIYDYGYDKNFLFKDRQLGQNVIINDKNVYDEFDADLITAATLPPQIDKSIYKSLGKHKYNINTFNVGGNSLELMFYVGGHTYQEAQLNVNKLIQEFIDNTVIIKLDESDFEYVCVIDSYKSEYTQVEFYYLVTIIASAVKRLPLVKLDYGSTYFTENTEVEFTFNNNGVINSGLDIIIRFGGDTSFTINCKGKAGKTNLINFTNISSSNYYYKVGGIDGVVHRAGNTAFSTFINVFLNTDLIDFPIVKPGDNIVKFIQNSTGKIKSVSLQFYPTFVI